MANILERMGLGGARVEMVERSLYEATEAQVGMLEESVRDLELALDDVGWDRIDAEAGSSFSREGLRKIATRCRTFAVANPLIKRGLATRAAFVFGGGVNVTAAAAGDDAGDSELQDVDAVIRAAWDDPRNQRAVTSSQAQERLERAHGTDGNVFIALFTNPRTGFVQMRTVPFDEVVTVIRNPDDKAEPWYYVRKYVRRDVQAGSGIVTEVTAWAAHPAEGFRPEPGQRPQSLTIAGIPGIVPVLWDAPVVHSMVNELDGWEFGIGDAYAALPWARMHRDFIRNWAVLMESLSQYAWAATPKGGQQSAQRSQKLRQQLQRTAGAALPGQAPAAPGVPPVPGNPGSVGATVTGMDITAIPKTGATIDADSGKPLVQYVAAALGLPITQLLGDPGVTGARAVAETLNGPQQLDNSNRQDVWGHTYQRIAAHIIREAVRAPEGPLVGWIERDPVTGVETVTLADDAPTSVEVSWAALTDETVLDKIRALAEADDTITLPTEWLLRRMLQVLDVDSDVIDEMIDELRDEEGNVVPPTRSNPALANAGAALVQAYRQGEPEPANPDEPV